jgi:type VI protein secretion system component Hcp
VKSFAEPVRARKPAAGRRGDAAPRFAELQRGLGNRRFGEVLRHPGGARMLQRWMGPAGFFGRPAATRNTVTATLDQVGSFSVESFNWGTEPPGAGAAEGGGGGAGKARFSEVYLTKRVDSVSPLLHHAAATAQYFKWAELVAGPGVVVRFADVNVSWVTYVGNGQEQVKLTFAGVTFEQASQ